MLTQEFLANKKILILDKSSTSRQLIEKALQQMGADKTLITSMKSYTYALEFVKTKKPDMIFTDFQIYDQYGLDLIPHQDQYLHDHSKRIFIVVTETANESAVADAAEEELDGYILKPFTVDYLTAYLTKIIEQKLVPNHYQTMISKAKALLFAGKLEDAILHFEMAINVSAKPSLALYYLGEIYRKKGETVQALQYFRQGQKITPLHFRCAVAEFMTLFEQQQFDEASTRL
jgi:two-component system chemotaxis response regulator CheY